VSSKKIKSLKVPLIISGALFLLSPLAVISVQPNNYRGGRSRNAIASMERNSSSIANIVGELRASVSDMIFIKTERYLHGGIGYVAHMEDISKASTEGEIENLSEAQKEFEEGDHDGHEHHEEEDDHAGTPTLIPAADKDFRGFIGHLERQVQPWKDPSLPHVHTDGTELLPWYRVMTISDPHNVRAYVLGAWWLLGENKPDEAFKFLNEGEKHNPDSFVIPYYRARVYMNEMRSSAGIFDDQERIRYRDMAIDELLRASKLALDARPETFDMQNIDYLEWSLYEEEDALATMRFTVLLLKDAERYEEALDLAKRAAPRFGYITETGQVIEEDGKLRQYIEELESLVGVPFPLARPEDM